MRVHESAHSKSCPACGNPVCPSTGTHRCCNNQLCCFTASKKDPGCPKGIMAAFWFGDNQ